MFHQQPQRRPNRRLPSGGAVVSYAEVKSYLSKREIPQLFESLMAGLMYHRPENHINYLQTCLEEVKTNSDTKVHWSTFVNRKKRKSKEILPPLTPKKQDSVSSWSDNSRQSTPLPPISAKTRAREDLRNTYILYHNPPPILAKPKVPVVSVLGGLGTRIDELCEKVVGRLRGVVHISTCSMLKTRMTIEGFYRVTSVPACAVVDSVLQAMSMVQSENALIVAGFPRNRGDIEEYRSRRVRLDGVVLVDFEEDALRRFLNGEVNAGAVRVTDVESELERYKQDIISVAEYYDEKDLLTVVMGDQDTEEMIEDMVIAVDKIIETRKHLQESEDSDAATRHEDQLSNGRSSTVEIRDATEEDIKAIEGDVQKLVNEVEVEEKQTSEEKSEAGDKPPPIPLLFAFENIDADGDSLKDLIVNEMGMCYINFQELVRDDDDEKGGRLGVDESLSVLEKVLQRDAVSYSNGFFISYFSFDLLKENKFDRIQKLGDVTFICKVKENTSQSEEERGEREGLLFDTPLSEQVRIVFVTEDNIVEELKCSLLLDGRGGEADSIEKLENDVQSQHETSDLGTPPESIDKEKNATPLSKKENEGIVKEETVDSPREGDKSPRENITGSPEDNVTGSSKENKTESPEVDKGDEEKVENELDQDVSKDKTSRDDNEDSTCQDVEDLVTDDTLNDGTKPKSDSSLKEGEIEDTLSQVSEEGLVVCDVPKEKAVLERQHNLDIETTSASESSTQIIKGEEDGKDDDDEGKSKLVRRGTYLSASETPKELEGSVMTYEQDLGTDVDDSSMKESDGQSLSGNKEDEVSLGVEDTVRKADDVQNNVAPDKTKSEEQVSEKAEESSTKDVLESEEESEKDGDGKSEREEKSEVCSEIGSKPEDIKVMKAVIEAFSDGKSEGEEKSEVSSEIGSKPEDIKVMKAVIEAFSDGKSEREEKSEVGSEIGGKPEDIKVMQAVIEAFSDRAKSVEGDSKADSKCSDVKAESEEGEVTENGNEPDSEKGSEDKPEVSGEEDGKADVEDDGKSDRKSASEEDAKTETSENVKNENGEEEVMEEKAETDTDEKSKSDSGGDKKTDEIKVMKTVVKAFSDSIKSVDGDLKTGSVESVEGGKSEDAVNGNTDTFDDKDAEVKSNGGNESERVESVSDKDQEGNSISSTKEDSVCDAPSDVETPRDDSVSLKDSKSDLEGSNADEDAEASSTSSPSEENSQIELSKPATAPDDEGETSAATEQPSEGVDSVKSDDPQKDIEGDAAQLIKVVDNDSDSNDENAERSITLQAEVHAPDSKSPLMVVDTDDKKDTEKENSDDEGKDETSVGKDEASMAEGNQQESTEDGTTEDQADNTETETSKPKPEEIHVMKAVVKAFTDSVKSVDGDSKSSDSKEGTTDVKSETSTKPDEEVKSASSSIEAAVKTTDADHPVTESECELDEAGDDSGVDAPLETDLKDLEENTEESQITTVKEMEGLGTDRYSAKHQERNGSGILGDSRHEDHPDGEETQERSSSSSRGEL